MAKNITIYKGSIHKVFAHNVKLVQEDKVSGNNEVTLDIVPVAKDILVDNDSLFYISREKFVNLDYDCVLPTDEEAYSYMKSAVHSRRDMLLQLLLDSALTKEEREYYLNVLRATSSCLYFYDYEVKPSFSLSKQEFKSLKKEVKKRR